MPRIARSAASLGLAGKYFATAEQVHGNKVAVIDSPLAGDRCYDGADGLITNQPGVSLGIYVADCGAVYLVDPVRRCLGLVHSGKKGTELAIVEKAIRAMAENFGSDRAISSCSSARAFARRITRSISRPRLCGRHERAGVEQVHDSGRCTASDLARYYSYRAEKARTGRMLALLALRS